MSDHARSGRSCAERRGCAAGLPASKVAAVISLLAAAGLPTGAASGQVTRSFTDISGGSWFDAGLWSPGGVPTALDTAIFNAGVFPAHGKITGLLSFAHALDLKLGTTGRGWLELIDGDLTVGHRMTLGETGGLGEFDIKGLGTLSAGELFVGQGGGGILTVSEDASIKTDHLVVAAGAASFYEKRMTQTGTSLVTVHGATEVGLAGPGTYELRGGDLDTRSLLIGGPGSTGTGVFRFLTPVAGDSLPTLTVRDDVQVGGGTAAGITGTLDIHGGIITHSSPDAEIFVHDGKGLLKGTGLWDIKVTYLDAVNVRFDTNSLLTAATMSVAPGLTTGNAGSGPPGDPGEIVSKFTPRLLASTDHTVTWHDGTGTFAAVDYDSSLSAPVADPKIEVPCDPSTATGTTRVPAANIASRVRMLQFGENILPGHLNGSATPAGDKPGEVRNITMAGGVIADKVVGQSPHVSGDFSVGVLGKAADPVHQNPLIAGLQDGSYDLRGRGVVMGQIEPGIPDTDFDCFEDWSMPTGKRASVLAAGGGIVTAHATLVASLMVGYDPLGVQVDGQSRFEPAGHRYGRMGSEGFGFTGVAPDAKLISMNDSGVIPSTTVLTTVASQPGMKIINESAAYPPPSPTFPTNGMHAEELTIDHLVEEKGIIFTVAAGNFGPGASTVSTPAGNYNGICVANAQFDVGTPDAGYPRAFDASAASTQINSSSSRGPTRAGDGRAKPDITAQGTDNLGAFMMEGPTVGGSYGLDPAYPRTGNRGLYSVRQRLSATSDRGNPGTSYSAPVVAGVAALMVEQARKNGSAAAEDPRVIKSIMQTTADKPTSGGGWQKGLPGAFDDTTVPLDYTWGAGIINPPKAVTLLDTAMIAHDAGPITRDGWSLSTLSDTDPPTFFGLPGQSFLLHDLADHSTLTATLNWYRHVDASLTTITLLNLDLQLYSWNGTIATLLPLLSSVSTIDNVEHIYVTDLPGESDYILRVSTAGFGGLSGETYGLSWDGVFVPSPGAAGMGLIVVTFSLTRRTRRT